MLISIGVIIVVALPLIYSEGEKNNKKREEDINEETARKIRTRKAAEEVIRKKDNYRRYKF